MSNLSEFCTILLSGGKGTRLLPLKLKHSKNMTLVNGQPLLFRLFKFYSRHSTTIVKTNSQIYHEIQNHAHPNIRFSTNMKSTGTARDFILAALEYNYSYYISTNGDTIPDIKYDEFLAFSKSYNAVLALTTHSHAQNPNAFYVGEKNRILFSEESGLHYSHGEPVLWRGASTGILFIRRELLLTLQECISLEKNLIPSLIEKKVLFAFCIGTKECLDIGVPARYQHFKKNEKYYAELLGS